MSRVEDFLSVVFLNLHKNGIDPRINDTVSVSRLRQGVKQYFGWSGDKPVDNFLDELIASGFVEITEQGFRFTGRAIEKFRVFLREPS